MRIICWQAIRMKYHTFFRKLGKIVQILSSAAVVISVLRVKQMVSLFVGFDSLRPINNLSVKQGRVFLG